MSAKPISRLQRDLTDSTVVRNIGTIFGHINIYNSLLSGLDKLVPNNEYIQKDLHTTTLLLLKDYKLLCVSTDIKILMRSLKI